MTKKLFSLLFSLLLLSTIVIFGSCTNEIQSPIFGDFVRIGENYEKIYVTEEQIKESLTEEQFVQYLSEDGKMRITLAITPCDELFPEFGGSYHVEAWFEWLEIPKYRGKDNISLEMNQTSWITRDTFSILRYQTKNGKVVEETMSSNYKTADWNLPNGNMTALQIYKEIYVTITAPSLPQYTSCFAEYIHNSPISKFEEYDLYQNIEYIPVIEE